MFLDEYSRINQIVKHPLYRTSLSRIEDYEKDRIFCKHDIEHFLSVARLAVILNIKENYNQPEELIYAVGLLHDIGRHIQYKTGEDHCTSSLPIASKIMIDCKFSNDEKNQVLKAISLHRNIEVEQDINLNGLLYRADKMSRTCFCCNVVDECDWGVDKKNSCLIR